MAKRASKSLSAKSSYKTLPPGTDMMMLAPFVVSMRMPALMWEAMTPQWSSKRKAPEAQKVLVEKAAAVMESYGAMNAEIMQLWSRIWLHSISGDVPNPQVISHAVQDIVDAGIEPAARRVRANYRRLRRA
ncbi:MAG: hypothetical protein AAFP99_05490 [Pseudomonadota bacterium]